MEKQMYKHIDDKVNTITRLDLGSWRRTVTVLRVLYYIRQFVGSHDISWLSRLRSPAEQIWTWNIFGTSTFIPFHNTFRFPALLGLCSGNLLFNWSITVHLGVALVSFHVTSINRNAAVNSNTACGRSGNLPSSAIILTVTLKVHFICASVN